MDIPSPLGRRVRIAITLAVGVLLVWGALWGQDDAFPFGPFRMYSTADKLNAPVSDTRFEIVDATGATVPLTEVNTGIRRAEIEGQLGRFKADPTLLRVIADAYETRNPSAPKPVTVRIVIREWQLSGGLKTGQYTDDMFATWDEPR
jgi:branched-subunit amino acid aminotransferase/4-amino-4-deoxychorismate lyase